MTIAEIRPEIRAAHPEPKCSDCSARVLVQKCWFDLDPMDCPRHEQKTAWEAAMCKAEREARHSGAGAGDVPMERE